MSLRWSCCTRVSLGLRRLWALICRRRGSSASTTLVLDLGGPTHFEFRRPITAALELPRPYLAVVELSPDFVYSLLTAKSPGALEQLFPPFLSQYLDHPDLLTGHPVWTPRTRASVLCEQEFLLGVCGWVNFTNRLLLWFDEQADLVSQLHARIQELESQVAARPSVQKVPTTFEAPRPKAPPTRLFEAEPGAKALDPSTLDKLKSMVGPPPRRLANMEGNTYHGQPAPTAAQNAAAEADAGALELEALAQIAETVDDPLQKLIALQMQQNALVVQKLISQAKPAQDRISAALGSESGSSSSGVKGCVARDAFVKTMEDVVSTGNSIMLCAASDLGIPEDQIHSGLLRDYMERRMPLGNHRMLSYISQFFAVGWQLSYEQGDQFAMGLLARGLMMAEQIALDSGRCQFGWLLSGMPEPDLQAIRQNKRRIGLKPYSKLAAAPWIAGNIAYLRDLDYLETRLKSAGPKQTSDNDQDESKGKKWKNRKGGKGKDEAGDSTTA